jgi:choline dehydrogenase-like flavoprotein
MIAHALDQMQTGLEVMVIGAKDIFRQTDDTNDLAGTARMGFDAEASVGDADCRSWDITTCGSATARFSQPRWA